MSAHLPAVPPVFSVRVRELLPAETVGWQFCVSPSSFLELNRQVFVTKRGARLADHEQAGSRAHCHFLFCRRSRKCRILYVRMIMAMRSWIFSRSSAELLQVFLIPRWRPRVDALRLVPLSSRPQSSVMKKERFFP